MFLKHSKLNSKAQSLIALCCLFFITTPALSLDLFTFWKLNDIPIELSVGSKLDFRTMKVEMGRRTESGFRIQCVAHNNNGWVIEIIPMVPSETKMEFPKPMTAWQFVLDDNFVNRKGDLIKMISSVVKLDGTIKSKVTDKEWKQDPLIRSSFESDFSPSEVLHHKPTSRVVSNQTIMCNQLEYLSETKDTIQLPKGLLIQTSKKTITVAVNKSIPLFGIAYAAEKLEVKSEFKSEKGRRKTPPPEMVIEVIELVDYGMDATSLFD